MGVNHPGVKLSFEELIRMVRREAVATLQNASIGRAGLRVYGGGWIRVEDGGLSVTGKQTVSGVLEGSGTLLWVGPWELRGDGKISGKTQVTGDTTITGKLGVTGNAEFGGNTVIKKDLDVQAKTRLRGKTTLEDDLEVLPGGKIKIGDMTIDPSGGAGRVRFANGGQVWAESNAIKMMIGQHAVSVSNGSVLIASGGYAFEVGSAGVKIVGPLPKTSAAGVPKGTLIRGAGGTLYEAE